MQLDNVILLITSANRGQAQAAARDPPQVRVDIQPTSPKQPKHIYPQSLE
ncbi:hypothetical protein LP414_31025 [Polaromonas sp. P1(28)-13]|nr:hypothetical protein LP414_31025 [Polaromonas sp. P1(28)-13]